jgi:hypothetical protein
MSAFTESSLDAARPATPWRRRLAVLVAVVLIAALLRGWAVLRLPLDYDEPTYLDTAFDYARAIRAGDLNGVIDYPGVREHPALVKLLYSLVVVALGPDASRAVALYASRAVSALFGTGAVVMMCLVDPLAGGLMAVHTLTVKYTSQAYLEAVPLFTSIGALLAFTRTRSARDAWFWLSALALGATAAGKYTYFPVLVPILYLAVWQKRIRWYHLLLYLAAAAAAFWLLDPTLWHQPVTRLLDSLLFHVGYSQGTRVQAAGLPWYQPLVWISRSPAAEWHPDVFFYPGIDGIIFFLALPGLYWQWRERRWVVIWFATALLFLLVWPTKWPQYILVLVPSLCLLASSTLSHVYAWLKEREEYWAWAQAYLIRPPLAFWIIVGVATVAFAVGYSAYSLQLTLGKLGWSSYTTENTALPSDTIYDIAAGANEQMILGTDQGAAIWEPPPATDLPDRWQVLTTANSGLPHNRVLAVAQDRQGAIWFGTQAGLARLNGSAWQVYRARDLGLAGETVYALAVDGQGRVWAGTNAGAAVFDGQTWTPYTAATSGLDTDRVLALATGDGSVWFGTQSGISHLDTASGRWADVTPPELRGSAVDALVRDSSGRLWAGTLGSGLGTWDGSTWQVYRAGTSGLPFNQVTALAEVRPGVIWIGTAIPNAVGGTLAEFDGQKWRTYDDHNSGFSGAEPLSIAADQRGRQWIGTRTEGINLYEESTSQASD